MEAPGLSAVRQAAMVFAIGLAIYAQRAVHQHPNDTMSWLVLPIVAIVAAAATRRELLPQPAAVPATARRPMVTLRLALGVVVIAAIATTTYLSTIRERPLVALLLWLAAPVLGSFAVRGWQITPARRADVRWSRREAALLAAVVLLAALGRTLWIATLPRAYFGDEPRVGMFLLNAYHAGAIPNFFTMGWNTWPVIGLSLQGVFAALFGVHIWTLRLSSALMGTLGVLFTYLLARELFAPRVALFAAILLALCRTAVDFSRVGIAHAQILCLEPLAFFFLWRALNRGRAVFYLWAGVATAWCLYSYNAGQLVPPLVFGWLGLGALLRPPRMRTHWRGAALLAAAFALTIFPYLYFCTDAFSFGPNWGQWTIMARNRQTLGRAVEAWNAGGFAPAWAILSQQAWTTWLGFGVLPGAVYILGYRRGGMLDDVSAALFVLGLGMAIRHLRQGGHAFVLYWWVATVIAGGIATIDPPAFVRLVGLLPALAILAALPLDWLTRCAAGAVPRVVAAALAVGLIAAVGWENYRTYFVEFAATPADPISELVRYMETMPADHRAVLLGAEHHLQLQGELAAIELPNRYRDVAETAHYLPIHEPVTAPLVLVLAASQTTVSDYVRALYSNPPATDVRGADNEHFFRAMVLDPGAVRARTGLRLTAQRSDGGTADLGRADPFSERIDPPADATRLVWNGRVYWPTDQPLPVTVDAGQPTVVAVGDATPVAADGGRPALATITLPRGWQPLRIEETVAAQRRLAIALGPGAAEPLTGWNLRPESGREGLLATYVRGDGSVVQAVDPQLNAFAVEDRFPPQSDLLVRMPFKATWRGALRVDTPGTYEFEALGTGPYAVRLDDAPLFTTAPAMPEQPALARASRPLAPGLHPIAAEFDSTKASHTTRRLFQLFWKPPGGVQQLIPPTNFVPD
jgi:hypothetical protein